MNIAYLWVALGGALGSVGRFWLNGIVSTKFTETAAAFPLGTLVINAGWIPNRARLPRNF